MSVSFIHHTAFIERLSFILGTHSTYYFTTNSLNIFRKSKKTSDSNSTPKPPKKRAKHDSESSDIVFNENEPPKADGETQVGLAR